jgi:hypothetical protein
MATAVGSSAGIAAEVSGRRRGLAPADDAGGDPCCSPCRSHHSRLEGAALGAPLPWESSLEAEDRREA